MSSTAYRDWASRRWRPTLPEADPRAVGRAKRLMRWQVSAAILIWVLVVLQAIAGELSHRGDRSMWFSVMLGLGAVTLALIALDVVATWLLVSRLAKAEASGVGR